MTNADDAPFRRGRPFLRFAWLVAGLAIGAALVSYFAGVLNVLGGAIMLALGILGPAGLRTAAKMRREGGPTLPIAILASLAVATVIAVATCITFCTVCTLGTLSLSAANDVVSPQSPLGASGASMGVSIAVSALISLLMFAGLSYWMWPRT